MSYIVITVWESLIRTIYLYQTPAVFLMENTFSPNSLSLLNITMNSNPHDAVRPDFNAEAHAPEKQALLDTGLTPEQAIQTLERLWTLQNNREWQEWNRLKEVAALAEAEAAQAVADAEEQRRREEQESDELAHREDRKKNKAKYAEIPNLMVPSNSIIFPSPYALKKLKKGDFVELYYFTNRCYKRYGLLHYAYLIRWTGPVISYLVI